MTTALDLRKLRLSKGLTQDVIGNRKDVGEIEKGRKLPGPRLVRRMASALGVTTDQVFAACVESQRRAGSQPDAATSEAAGAQVG